MPLAANSRLGPYEIKSVLGVGGMGEVYRARDSRLNRDVAVKVLRSDSTATPELKSRFEREARAVAALNHPNIVSVFDFGIDKVDGAEAQYIVSELIEGESLRQVIANKPVATRRLVDIAVQIADGLAAAHAAGIVHRDLKPENILVTKDGRAKILDFGLARQTAKTVPANSSDETFLPDSNANLTSAGSILGTASYMSPEQAVGKETDYRSDQFSFGLILHEMATGKQAFARNSSVETMAAIVRDEPPPIEEKLPAPLKWIIDRCLNKEPEQRYESTRDLYRDLKSLRDHFSEAYPSSGGLAPIARVGRFRLLPRWLIAALACGLCLGVVLTYLLLPRGQFIANYRYTPLAPYAEHTVWSPDGASIAYSGMVDGIPQVFLRYLNSPVAVQITHEKRAVMPLGWSSDRGHLLVMESADATGGQSDLFSVATVGGELEAVTSFQCFSCALSRDGKALATFIKGTDGNYIVRVSDPVGSPFRDYAPAPFATRDVFTRPELVFSPDGKKLLLFFFGMKDLPQVWLLPYPAGRIAPKQLSVGPGFLTGINAFSWMPDSRRLVVSLQEGGKTRGNHLWMADTESTQLTQLTVGTADEFLPAVSPDGKSVLFSQGYGPIDVASVSLENGTLRTMVTTGQMEAMPAWSASQQRLVWVSNRNGPYEVWIRQADGSDRPVVTAANFPAGSNKWFISPSLSPDGERVIYERVDTAMTDRLWISSIAGGQPVRLTDVDPSGEFAGSWSPDGGRFVYLQRTAGVMSLMLARTLGNVKPTLLKENVLEAVPEWSPAGDWITFRDSKGWSLISQDGQKVKFLGDIEADYLAFSKDGKLLYAIVSGGNSIEPFGTGRNGTVALVSIDPENLKMKLIRDLGRDGTPVSPRMLGLRLSVAPDGKTAVYSTGKFRYDLWMLQDYRQPGLWNQLTSAFSPKTGN